MNQPTAPQFLPPTDHHDGADPRLLRAALLRYRSISWVVGLLLIASVTIGVYLSLNGYGDGVLILLTRAAGLLWFLLLIAVIDLGRRVQWGAIRIMLLALGGAFPVASFIAQYFAVHNAKGRIALAEAMRAHSQ